MSRISDLHPAFQDIATKIVNWATAAFGPVVTIVVSDAWRTPTEQAQDHASGSSGVNLGWHNYGFAFDFLLYENGVLIEDGNDPRYAQVGAYAASLGCKYPIHLPSGDVDHDHIEWHPNYTLATLQSWLSTHTAPTV